jgi:hypothetical protein
MALIPTLKLWPYEFAKAGVPAEITRRFLDTAQEQRRAFVDVGGQVLFGIDVGYMTDYDPTDKYVYMQRAGLSYPQILAALTTASAARFGSASRAGRLASRLRRRRGRAGRGPRHGHPRARPRTRDAARRPDHLPALAAPLPGEPGRAASSPPALLAFTPAAVRPRRIVPPWF